MWRVLGVCSLVGWSWYGSLITCLCSMWPLLKRDGLGVQYLALTLLWNYVIGHNPLRQTALRYLTSVCFEDTRFVIGANGYFQSIYSAIALLHLAELLYTPPPRYPDLFPVLNALLCAGVFGLAYLWSLKRLVELGWAMGSLRNAGTSTTGGNVNVNGAGAGTAASRTIGRPPPSPLEIAGHHPSGSISRDRVASLSLSTSSSLRRRNPAVGRPTLGVDIPFESREENVVDLSEPLGMDAP